MRKTIQVLALALLFGVAGCSSQKVMHTTPAPAATPPPSNSGGPTPITENTPFPEAPVTPGNAVPAAAEAVPSDAVPGALPATQPAKTLAGAILFGQPRPNSQDTQPLPAGTTVQVVSPLTNGTGTWWYVKVQGIGGGWVQENLLSGLPPR